MSHSACKPVADSVLGQRLDDARDIRRINAQVRANSLDLLQAEHTLSGIDVALWDLLGRKHDEPVYRLLGYPEALPRTAYASQLFADDPPATFARAQAVARAGFRAAKFGWGPYGRATPSRDAEQVRAAREGLGHDRVLLVDAGTVWGDDVAAAAERLFALKECRSMWLEEPFVSGALGAYRRLADLSAPVKLAGGEGCHNFHQAQNLIDYAGVGFVQIDTGRIGGITTAKQVADYAHARGVTYVNHTFTTHLALSASLQPYAGLAGHDLCEYPVDPSALAQAFTTTRLVPDADGVIRLPEGAGLGLEPDWPAVQKYLQAVEIKVGGRVLFASRSPGG
jgi:L-alanine-DL-glutamate epimerase-like enolase superfamily enzyme